MTRKIVKRSTFFSRAYEEGAALPRGPYETALLDEDFGACSTDRAWWLHRCYGFARAHPAVGGARGREKLGHERVRRPFLASGNRVKKAGEKNGRGHEAV